MNNVADFADWLSSAYAASNTCWDADTTSQGLDLTSKDGALAGVVLGILYAFTVQPVVAERGVNYLLSRNMLDVKEFSQKAQLLEGFKNPERRVERIAPELVEALTIGYGRIPRVMAVAILRACFFLDTRFGGDPRTIYRTLNYDAQRVIQEIQSWRARLSIKGFWLAREMRMQEVWTKPNGEPIDGAVCCVVDVQVRRALQHLDCFNPHLSLLQHSNIIWTSFGELYDYPLLWFGREHCGKVVRMIKCPLNEKCPSRR